MVEEQAKKVEPEAAASVTPTEDRSPVQDENQGLPNGVVEQKSPAPTPVSEKAAVPVLERTKGGPDKDDALERLEIEKRNSLIKAWEENEKAKIDNKAQKKFSAIRSWENIKKASVEAQLKKFEEKLEKRKAEYREKMNNRVAEIHKAAEQKRAVVEAKRGEHFVKIEETAAKYRANGYSPKKLLGCFGG